MKTFALFTLFLSLISNIYSYQLSKNNTLTFPELEISYTPYNYNTGYPQVEVVYGPNHFENDERYIDVLGTANNYMKNYLPDIEYRVTSVINRFDNDVYVDMVQQYKNVDIYSTHIRLVINRVDGRFTQVTTHIIKNNFSGVDYENRGEEKEEAKKILKEFNKKQFNGSLDLSKIYDIKESFNAERNEYKFEKIPFADGSVYLKKTYLILNTTIVQPSWKLRFNYVYQDPLEFNGDDDIFYPDENKSTVFLSDENGEVIVSENFDFHEDDIKKFKQGTSYVVTSKTLPTRTTTVTTVIQKAAKQIPTTKQISIPTYYVSKALPTTRSRSTTTW